MVAPKQGHVLIPQWVVATTMLIFKSEILHVFCLNNNFMVVIIRLNFDQNGRIYIYSVRF